MKNIEKWVYPICYIIANGEKCPAHYNGHIGFCDDCELEGLCNDTWKLFEYMNKEIEGNDEHE